MGFKKVEIENCKEEILRECFDCLAECGLERITDRALREATGLTASSLYYRFNDKDEIVFEATFWGLETITKELFWQAIQSVDSFDNLFRLFLSQLELFKAKLKLIYQVAASPRYGERFRMRATALGGYTINIPLCCQSISIART